MTLGVGENITLWKKWISPTGPLADRSPVVAQFVLILLVLSLVLGVSLVVFFFWIIIIIAIIIMTWPLPKVKSPGRSSAPQGTSGGIACLTLPV